MNFTTNQLEHINKALKLYLKLWNSMTGVPKFSKLSQEDIEELERLIENINNEIRDRKLHE